MTRVLVVDDDFMVASIHRQYVERIDGFRVVGEAHSGRQALDMVAEHQPDLMLLDIYLPDMSGLDVMRSLPADAGVDVVAITAARDVETLRTAMRFGAMHYLVKPFTFPMLREKLGQYTSWTRALQHTTITGQAEVDRLVGVLRSDTYERALPKGLCETTLALIEGIVVRAGDELTSIDVARAAGVSRVTARRYLEFLQRAERVTMRARYGTSGRPVHMFSASIAQ